MKKLVSIFFFLLLLQHINAQSPTNRSQVYHPINIDGSINSKFRDYSPCLTADGQRIIFSRNVEGNEDLYEAVRKNGKWTQAVALGPIINTSRYSEGAPSISPDGMYLFFAACNKPDGLGRCDIYVSERKGATWSKPFNLGAPLNSEYWDSQPAISPDGNMLYFVSNRPGGIGGYDIWKSELGEDGYWRVPENMGKEINTRGNEHTPFIHADGKTLYFSSDGWPGLGNKDIFYCRLNDSGTWGTPVNFGSPINTDGEETGLIVTPDGTEGWFSANLKDGLGDMDIYSFKMPESARPQSITYVKGTVRDKATKTTIDAKVEVTDLSTGKTQFSDYTSDEGTFLSIMPLANNYALHVSAEGYLFYSENFELKAADKDKPFIIDIFLEKIAPGSNVILKNIFFETNKYDLLPASLSELNTLAELLLNNKNVAIEIQGHTDNVGDDKANQKLSLLRAKAVFEYLVGRQVAAERLSFKGYGEVSPIAPNETEDGRKQNRRTSFVITKT